MQGILANITPLKPIKSHFNIVKSYIQCWKNTEKLENKQENIENTTEDH